MSATPDAPGTTVTPYGDSTMISSSERSPASTCAIVWRGERPRNTSTLARPRSPSSSSTRLPVEPSAVARFTATLVLPTPPLPPVTAITCTGPGLAERFRPVTCTDCIVLPSKSCQCVRDRAEPSLQQILIRVRAGFLGKLDGARDQLMRSRRTQIFWNLLAVAEISERQLGANERGERAAEAGGLVELRDAASCRTRRCETFERLFDCAGLRSGREHKTALEAVTRVGESLQFGREARIALAQAGAVDQYETAFADVIERLGQLACSIDRVCGDAEQSAECVNLLLRADADAVRRDQREIARAVTQNPTSGELRDQRRLADAGRTDQRDDTAAFHPALANGLDATSHQREREALRFGQLHSLRQLTHELASEIVCEAEHCQLTQQLRLNRRATREIVPRERCELRLQHAAQSAQFFISIRR